MKNDVTTSVNDEPRDTTSRRPESRRVRIYPAYEVWEETGSIHLRLEMPGLERDDVTITLENNQLVISGARPDWQVQGAVIVRERRVGDYYRAFTLDKTIDNDAINARMKEGVLDITLGVAKESQPRRIKITTG